jgi:hypothetical protein
MADKAEKEYTSDEVATHNKNDDCWLVIGNESNGKTILQPDYSKLSLSIAL